MIILFIIFILVAIFIIANSGDDNNPGSGASFTDGDEERMSTARRIILTA